MSHTPYHRAVVWEDNIIFFDKGKKLLSLGRVIKSALEGVEGISSVPLTWFDPGSLTNEQIIERVKGLLP